MVLDFGNVIADVILVIFALSMIFFYAKRGFIKSLIHSLKGIIAFVVAYMFGGKLADVLAEKLISSPVRESVFKKVSSIYADTADAVNVEKITESFPNFIMTEEVKTKIAAAEGSTDQLINSVTDSIASPITNVISTVIGYILVFVLAFIGLCIVASILSKLVDHFSLFGFVDKLLGAVIGAVITFAALFVICSIIKFFFADESFYTNSVLVQFFAESSFLETVKFLDIGNLLG